MPETIKISYTDEVEETLIGNHMVSGNYLKVQTYAELSDHMYEASKDKIVIVPFHNVYRIEIMEEAEGDTTRGLIA